MMPDSSVSVISCLDLTDRKRAEEELKIREKIQGVLEMAGAVCHELNQPLQVITSAAELLLTDETVCDMDHELLGTIQDGVEKIGSLTQKIMKITGYEVKDYLGGKGRIIDIDRSSSCNDLHADKERQE
jgi:signal transduction histidine kinase